MTTYIILLLSALPPNRTFRTLEVIEAESDPTAIATALRLAADYRIPYYPTHASYNEPFQHISIRSHPNNPSVQA
jgi:hypothetical protein